MSNKRKKTPDIAAESAKSSKKLILSVTAVIMISVLTGIIATIFMKNKPAAKTMNNGKILTITDPATGRNYTIPINPPSSSADSVVSVTSNASGVPSGDSSARKDFSYLFKKAESKTVIAQITIEEAKYLYDSGKALFIDARGDNQYNELHIKGAISIPAGAEPAVIEKYASKLKSAKVLVTYCHGVGCHLADKTAYLLYDAGYHNVVIFFGGWNQWMQANYPVSK